MLPREQFCKLKLHLGNFEKFTKKTHIKLQQKGLCEKYKKEGGIREATMPSKNYQN